MSKSFGALKSAVLRMLNKGYAPEVTQITVSVADRERLRCYCESHDIPSMVEGFSRILTLAHVPESSGNTGRRGRLSSLIEDLKIRARENDSGEIAARVRAHEFDDYLKQYHSDIQFHCDL